jgi:hypothetical protein
LPHHAISALYDIEGSEAHKRKKAWSRIKQVAAFVRFGERRFSVLPKASLWHLDAYLNVGGMSSQKNNW